MGAEGCWSSQIAEQTEEDIAMLHAGVLEFTAVEGTIAVPPLVARNLFGAEAGVPQGHSVTVTYQKLQKGR